MIAEETQKLQTPAKISHQSFWQNSLVNACLFHLGVTDSDAHPLRLLRVGDSLGTA
jgi:hypothetical protein